MNNNISNNFDYWMMPEGINLLHYLHCSIFMPNNICAPIVSFKSLCEAPASVKSAENISKSANSITSSKQTSNKKIPSDSSGNQLEITNYFSASSASTISAKNSHATTSSKKKIVTVKINASNKLSSKVKNRDIVLIKSNKVVRELKDFLGDGNCLVHVLAAS